MFTHSSRTLGRSGRVWAFAASTGGVGVMIILVGGTTEGPAALVVLATGLTEDTAGLVDLREAIWGFGKSGGEESWRLRVGAGFPRIFSPR